MEKNPTYIDIHAHVTFAAYEADREDVVARAFATNTWMINVGTKQSTSQHAVDLAAAYDAGVYAVVGLHPIHTSASFHDVDEIGEGGIPFNSHGETVYIAVYEALLKHPKVVGVGECGLDFFRPTEDRDAYIERQRDAFIAQIELAYRYDKPLMIHCRDAYPEVLDILSTYRAKYGERCRGNFHFFAGNEAQAKQILDLGFTMSFTGVVTFAKDYIKLVEYVPLDRMMSETDCPYVTPVPYRGQRNEPMYVSEVVKKIAEIKDLDFLHVQQQLVTNARQFFNI